LVISTNTRKWVEAEAEVLYVKVSDVNIYLKRSSDLRYFEGDRWSMTRWHMTLWQKLTILWLY